MSQPWVGVVDYCVFMAEAVAAGDLVSKGRAALARGAWESARGVFLDALAHADSPEAWDGLGWATWWLDDAPACITARERAYRGYRDRGDQRGAARMALWLGDDYLEFRGEEAVASGWFQRAVRILADVGPCPEQAWLAGFQAYAAMGTADTAEARRLSERARELGRSQGLVDLELMALAMEGVVLVDEGAVAQGMRRLDEAAAGALSGDCEELTGVAYTCCLVVATCDRVRDVDRGVQWCTRVEEFSRRRDVRFVHGACQAHHAAVLMWHGDWQAAEELLAAAVDELDGRRPWWRLEAVVRLAELRRRQGRLAEAEELFAEAEPHPLARLGIAELRLDRGDVDTACALLERALRAIPRDRLIPRAAPLELLVRATAAAGGHDAAGAHLAELRTIAAGAPIGSLEAAVSFAEGIVAATIGDHESARQRLGDAVETFAANGAPYEMSRARLLLAESLAVVGRVDAAVHEATAALRRFDELGAAEQGARARSLLERLGVAPPRRGGPSPLTARQVEVLTLVARGLTDREIATRLVLSEHTVHRHVANIYARLGCSSRAAAVAEAARLGLL